MCAFERSEKGMKFNMQKKTKVIIGIVAVAIVIIAVVVAMTMNSTSKTNLEPINSAEDLSALIEKIYEGEENLYPTLNTTIVDTTDDMAVKSATGLENANDLEYIVISEPMITSQAYSLVLAKVKEGKNASEIAKTMNENIDARKWICVSAEKVYTTSSGDVICLVMASQDMAKPIYEKFKLLAGNVGQEFEKSEQELLAPEAL